MRNLLLLCLMSLTTTEGKSQTVKEKVCKTQTCKKCDNYVVANRDKQKYKVGEFCYYLFSLIDDEIIDNEEMILHSKQCGNSQHTFLRSSLPIL